MPRARIIGQNHAPNVIPCPQGRKFKKRFSNAAAFPKLQPNHYNIFDKWIFAMSDNTKKQAKMDKRAAALRENLKKRKALAKKAADDKNDSKSDKD